MKYVNLTSFVYSDKALDALSISKADEFSVSVSDRCLHVSITDSTTIDDLLKVGGFVKIADGEIPVGTWKLYSPTTINRLKIVPKYEYVRKMAFCYLQEKVNSILDYEGNVYIVVKPDISGEDYVDLIKEFFYVLNPDMFDFAVNFTGFTLDGGSYITNDRYVFSEDDYMLIDVWNYVYDYQAKLASQFDSLQVYQYDQDFDDDKYEHLKMLESSYTQFEGQGGLITQNWREVDLYTTKQILSITASFQYQCMDRRIFDARVVDFYQAKFLANLRWGELDELPEGVDREKIDVSYSCTPSEIKEVTVVDQSTDTSTERYLYVFNFDVDFICPVYRRMAQMPKILEIVYRLHAKLASPV